MNTPGVSPVILRLKWVAEYHGLNPYADSAVVVGTLAADRPLEIAQVRVACENLWAQLGSDHAIDDAPLLGEEDALLVLGRAAAAWALAALNEVRGFIAHAGAERTGDIIRLWLGFHNPPVSRAAMQLALKSLVQLIKGQFDPVAFKAELERLSEACRRLHPDWQARILMVGACEMGVPFFQFLPGSRYWQFGWGAQARVFFETASNADGALGWQWQRDKVVSKDLLNALGLPAPAHVLVENQVELAKAVAQVGYPCVVKPLDGGGGKGVTAGIHNEVYLKQAFQHARRFSKAPIMVEQHVRGIDFRLMVLNGKLLVVIQREASSVIGDGSSSVRELLARLNAERSDNLVKSRYLRPIKTDSVLIDYLASQGIGLDEVLPVGTKIPLRSNANRSTGGICTDVTGLVHPDLRAMAEQLAIATGLSAVGLDYLTTDISRSPSEVGGAFIEINATPGMAVCVAAGWAEADIARLILGPEVGGIPVTLSVVDDAALQRERGAGLMATLTDDEGWVCGDDLRVGGARLHNTSPKPWAAVQAALRNQRLTRLQVVCTPADIQRHGLPVDRFEYVQVESADLPEPWLELLKRVSKHGVTFSQSMHEPSPVG